MLAWTWVAGAGGGQVCQTSGPALAAALRAGSHTMCAAPLNVVSKIVARRVLGGAEGSPRGGLEGRGDSVRIRERGSAVGGYV